MLSRSLGRQTMKDKGSNLGATPGTIRFTCRHLYGEGINRYTANTSSNVLVGRKVETRKGGGGGRGRGNVIKPGLL